MHSPEINLESLSAEIWRLLFAAVEDPLHPWRTPTLGTTDEKGHGNLRTIVLRRVNFPERTLIAFTDRRSPKVNHIAHQPQVEWLFYDPAARVQLRLTGTLSVSDDQRLIEEFWRETPEPNRRNYRTSSPPGTPLASPTPSHSSTSGQENFCVLSGVVESMEWLQLLPDQNLRAQWNWQSGTWQGTWVTP